MEYILPGITAQRWSCTCGDGYDYYCPCDGWRLYLPEEQLLAEMEAEKRALQAEAIERELDHVNTVKSCHEKIVRSPG